MTFGEPQYLYALAILPALYVFVRWALARRAEAVQNIGDSFLTARLGVDAGRIPRTIRLALWFIAVTLIILALARPQWGSDIEIVEQRGVQIMVALDVSRSMLSQDTNPSRLERAKLEISDLISHLEGDEIGIVLFSGASFIQFPLTSDYASALTYLHHARPSAISRQGTAIGEAIGTAMAGFSHERDHQKVIVILTDGENHEGDPVAAAQQAAQEGAVIFTVGFGSPEGNPVPERDESGDIVGYRIDAEGQPVISKLDEQMLVRIAEAGGGRYFQATNAEAVTGLTNEIRSFQDSSLQSEFSQRRAERFQLFLLAGAVSLFLAEMMSDRLLLSLRGRRTHSERRVQGA